MLEITAYKSKKDLFEVQNIHITMIRYYNHEHGICHTTVVVL